MRLSVAATALLVCASAFAQQPPRIFYSKDFPGSQPALAIITLERDGSGVYKEAPDDPQPINFKLTQAEADQVFALAEKLGHFNRPLEGESKVKVANMGMKTFRWEDGSAKPNEVKFNFTLDEDGRAMADWFDRIIETESQLIALERTVKFDKLGTYQAILILQAAIDRNRLVSLEQFLPLLDRVVKNGTYLNVARERAAAIAEWIRNPVAPPPAADQATGATTPGDPAAPAPPAPPKEQ
jgi:hypothetical protein